MKKKILILLGLICFILPCMVLFTGCNDGDGDEYYNIYSSASADVDVTFSKTKAKAGETIVIDAEVLLVGYEIVGYTVDGEPIEGNTFVMPDDDVSVNVIYQRAHYTVNIRLNDATRGNMVINATGSRNYEGNGVYTCEDFTYGDTLRLRISANDGYYLRNYSDDLDENDNYREIEIKGDMDIVANLEEGYEACTYYGYKIVMHGEMDVNLYNVIGNQGWYVRYSATKNYSDGSMLFLIADTANFGYFEFNYNGTQKLLFRNNSFVGIGTMLDKEQFDTLYPDYDGGWIDVYERDTRIGAIYTTYNRSYAIEDVVPELGEFSLDVFDGHNAAWLYCDNETMLKSNNFEDNGENAYIFNVQDLKGDGFITIQEYDIFTVGGVLYYHQDTNKTIYDEDGIVTDMTTTFKSTVDGVEYTLTFSYTE